MWVNKDKKIYTDRLKTSSYFNSIEKGRKSNKCTELNN